MRNILLICAAVFVLAGQANAAQKTISVGTAESKVDIDTNFSNIEDNFGELYNLSGNTISVANYGTSVCSGSDDTAAFVAAAAATTDGATFLIPPGSANCQVDGEIAFTESNIVVKYYNDVDQTSTDGDVLFSFKGTSGTPISNIQLIGYNGATLDGNGEAAVTAGYTHVDGQRNVTVLFEYVNGYRVTGLTFEDGLVESFKAYASSNGIVDKNHFNGTAFNNCATFAQDQATYSATDSTTWSNSKFINNTATNCNDFGFTSFASTGNVIDGNTVTSSGNHNADGDESSGGGISVERAVDGDYTVDYHATISNNKVYDSIGKAYYSTANGTEFNDNESDGVTVATGSTAGTTGMTYFLNRVHDNTIRGGTSKNPATQGVFVGGSDATISPDRIVIDGVGFSGSGSNDIKGQGVELITITNNTVDSSAGPSIRIANTSGYNNGSGVAQVNNNSFTGTATAFVVDLQYLAEAYVNSNRTDTFRGYRVLDTDEAWMLGNTTKNDTTSSVASIVDTTVDVLHRCGNSYESDTAFNPTALTDDDICDDPADDTAYDATSWDDNTDAATKNAIRDKIETMGSAGEANVQSDWNVTDTGSDAHILNKPTLSSGDVVGPASAVDNTIVIFDSTTGKLIQEATGCTISAGVITCTGGFVSSAADTYRGLTLNENTADTNVDNQSIHYTANSLEWKNESGTDQVFFFVGDEIADADIPSTIARDAETSSTNEWLPIGWAEDGTTAPADIAAVTGTTRIKGRAFDGAANEDVTFIWKVPAGFSGTTVTASVSGIVSASTAPANTEVVAFGVAMACYANSELSTIAVGTAQTTSITADATYAQYDSLTTTASSAITPAGSIAAGEECAISVIRLATTTDTYAQDLNVSSIDIFFEKTLVN